MDMETQRESTENDAIKHFALLNVLGGQNEKTVGGIAWSALQIKRADPNFDHMGFWKSLSKED